ncbi:P-loop containing nucleoside triphosphate hydrolase protein [Irpex rosettiformis]|uniref:P-loop containing nucleoside triphosphate hydrolase protein n=1 Tax=Irpex rosettiformis TaxID=378272 RepID=A0ACB8TUQ3_9APHY|nr:P-loop containing nucleoside triphosphate hydrolase protein [Irpex rosettiformis]
MDVRTKKLNRHFHSVLNGEVSLNRTLFALFLEAICAQTDAVSCVDKIIASKSGLESLQKAMFVDLSTTFMNDLGARVLAYFMAPPLKDVGGGAYLQQIVMSIVEPPVLWRPLVQAHRDKKLTQPGEHAFAWLLLQLVSLSAETSAQYRTLAEDGGITLPLLSSSDADVRSLGHKIKHIVDTCSVSAVLDPELRPGGRHDNDHADFRKINILPTADEVTSKEQPFLRTAAEVDEVDVSERLSTHLDNQFRLYREDMLFELRDELQIVFGQKKGYHRGLVVDDLRLVDLHAEPGPPPHKYPKWGVTLRCAQDLPFFKKVDHKKRKEYLSQERRLIKDMSMCAIIVDGNVIAFPKVRRDENYLAKTPPEFVLQFEGERATIDALCALRSANNIQLVQIDTAVFAYEPVLKRLQQINQMPLWRDLLASEPGEITSLVANPSETTKIARALETNPLQNLQYLLRADKAILLDNAQAMALHSGLTQAVSLIQGPPGTGKSFIGALIAKTFHDTTDETILVCCYTNHALDQFLEDLMDIGIPSTSLVRLGGKSTTRTEPLSLYNQRSRSKFGRADWTYVDSCKAQAVDYLQKLRDSFQGFTGKISFALILDHIQFEDSDYYEAFRVPDHALSGDVKFVGKKGATVDEMYLINEWYFGRGPGIFHDEEHIKTSTSVWNMSRDARRAKYGVWNTAIYKERAEELYERGTKYNTAQSKLDRKFAESEGVVLKSKRIIGCTTTAAAKYSEDLRAADPGILLVEEAGEILESHVLTALGEETRRIVLIGDHKQLRPKVENYQLTVEKGDGYDLNRSLFERLVLREYPHQTLSKQHRMRPEIANLVRQLTYPDLVDADKTKNRPDIRGLQDNIIFFTHAHPEDENERLANSGEGGAKSSKQNKFEVNMVLKVLRYLGQQGYGTEKVVILTPYLGQLHCLQRALREDNDPILNDLDSAELVRFGLMSSGAAKLAKKPIRLATIDNYQGEESDIVIVSLTRSNPNRDIGFMFSPERVNVLLSRARDGLIMVGNAETFSNARNPAGKALWTKVFTLLRADGHVYDGIPVKCDRHPSRKALLSSPADFDRECPEGGCKEPCGAMLSCGVHSCSSKCHQIFDHSKVTCTQVMDDRCSNGHKRVWRCHETAPVICKKCEKKAEEAVKKRQKDFEHRQKREAEEREHALRIAKLDGEIALEREAAQDRLRAKERADALAQKQMDLENARVQAANKAKAASVRDPNSANTNSSPPIQSSSTKPQPAPRHSPEPDVDVSEPAGVAPSTERSPAEDDWRSQKEIDGASNESIDAIMAMTGLENVKAQVLRIKAKIDLAQRQGTTLKDERFNIVLLGNPGTGKTTVARHYAKFLTSVDVLPGDEFVETTGSRLANEGVPGIKKKLEDVLKAGGGAIFIDEAYQLTGSSNFGGGQVLDFLLAEMENNVGKLVFILAGYNRQMEKFFEHNPGLTSRVPYRLQFEDYTDSELHLMLERLIAKKYAGQMKVEGGMQGLYMRIAIRRLGRGRGRDGFGNARALHNMLSTITERQAARIRKQRRSGKAPDDFVLLKEDLIGPDPSKAVLDSEAWKTLQSLIGLGAVKNSVQNLFDIILDNYRRELKEKKPIQMSLNKVFLGNPGTGKTTVAKLYGQILADLGLLTNGEVIVKNPSDLIGSVLGESERNTKAILAATVGKVLVIDEAYMLYGGASGRGKQNDPYKDSVIDTIVAEVQSVPGEDRCVLLLGYEPQIREMFQNVNPGLSRRFAIEDAFRFEDFSEAELLDILNLKLKQQDLDASADAKVVAIDVLSRARNRPNFGNGGEVENLLAKAKNNYQSRQAALPLAERALDVVYQPVDFDPEFDRSANSDQNLEELFADVIGCENIVAKLREYQNIARIIKQRGQDVKSGRDLIPTTFQFKGPPGTGKTTTARKMGQVYYDMGFLSSTEVVECSASDLVADYVGQTGHKTKKLFERALGKVLFIDEAYRLSEGPFAKEAMDELVGILTQDAFAGKLVVILAGYDQEMNQLMAVNPGLSSRFPETITFENMSPAHCLDILHQELSKNNIRCDALTERTSADYHEMVGLLHNLACLSSWGNARDMKTLSKQMIRMVYSQTTIMPNADKLLLNGRNAISCIADMLLERQSRATNVPTSIVNASGSLPVQNFHPGPRKAPSTSTSHAVTTAAAPTEPSIEPTSPESTDTERDVGVTDAVWHQLLADKQAELEAARRRQQEIEEAEKAEANARRVEETARVQRLLLEERARQQAEDDELRRRLEEQRIRELEARAERERLQRELEARKRREMEERKREAQAQQKLRSMGVCPAGFLWIKQSSGYRCAGGSHFVSDAQLGL